MRTFGSLVIFILWCILSLPAAAQTPAPHAKPPRPLIFLPGIAGSELWLNGKRAWGSLEALLSLEDLRIPDGPTRISPAPTCDPANHDVKYRASCGPINQLVILGWIKYDQYEPLFKYLETLGYTRFGSGKNLFMFAYDWRRSNFDTAADLDRFIRTTPELADKEVDLLAHSMGGLVSLIYAHRHDAPAVGGKCDFPRNCRLKTVVTMGTPFWGSTNALSVPALGWGFLTDRLPGGQDAITRTVLSWPSLYEMLPTHEVCCAISDGGTPRSLDLLKAEDFAALPYNLTRAGVSTAHLAEALKAAADLKKLADRGFPAHVRNANACQGIPAEGFFPIAGDHEGTRENLVVSKGKMNFTERRGDGTVLLRSATLGYPAGASLSFAPHMTIFDDQYVKTKIEEVLFRCDMSFKNFDFRIPMVAVSKTFGPPDVLPIDFVSAEVEDVTSGGLEKIQIRGALSLTTTDDAIGPKALLRVTLNGKEFHRADVEPASRRLDGSTTRFDYQHGPLAITGSGVLAIEMTFGDNGPTARDVTYVFDR